MILETLRNGKTAKIIVFLTIAKAQTLSTSYSRNSQRSEKNIDLKHPRILRMQMGMNSRNIKHSVPI